MSPSAGPPAKTIVVAGDSHMAQFLPSVAPIARENNWRVLTMIRPGCPFSTSSDSNIGEVPCLEWNAAAIAEIEATRPDAVVAGASRNVRVGLTEQTPPGFVEAWRRLERAGVPVLAVRDNARFDYSPPGCVDQHGRNADACVVPRAELYGPNPPYTRAGAPDTVTFFDTATQLCDDRRCPPEVGNTTVYLDDNHLTATFAASMAPAVGEALRGVVGD